MSDDRIVSKGELKGGCKLFDRSNVSGARRDVCSFGFGGGGGGGEGLIYTGVCRLGSTLE